MNCNVDSMISLFSHSSIDPNSNHIEISLKGIDVGDKDPAPKPERRKNKRKLDKDEDFTDSENEDDKILKKLRTGLAVKPFPVDNIK